MDNATGSCRFFVFLVGCAVCLFCHPIRAQVPQVLNYQGRVAVSGTNFTGTGQFKFALVSGGSPAETYWSNDGNSVAGSAPVSAVSLEIAKGLYSVLLGDTSLVNMTAIPTTVFSNSDVRLRVWFSDGSHGWQLLGPDQRIAAVGYAVMAGGVPNGSITGDKIASHAITAAHIAQGAVGKDQLAPGAAAANLNASGGGIGADAVFSQTSYNESLIALGYSRMGKLNLEDTWEYRGSPTTATPQAWTGTEMVFGAGTATGGRYNPATRSWTAVSTVGSPAVFGSTSTVWTGSRLIVWRTGTTSTSGTSFVSAGGIYDPSTDSWAPMSVAGAPAGRSYFSAALWTGTEMMVWGGSDGSRSVKTGGRYNPATDTWTSVSETGLPAIAWEYSTVWTGTEMIIWGGVNTAINPTTGVVNIGGRYNPQTDTWTAVSTTNAPAARHGHTAVWTGTEMIIWGGYYDTSANTYYLTGFGRYNPSTDTWISCSTTGTPNGRYAHTSIWTGTEMIVWGGRNASAAASTGGRYNPKMDIWESTGTTSVSARRYHWAVWTGNEMLIHGGADSSTVFSDNWAYVPGNDVYLYQKR